MRLSDAVKEGKVDPNAYWTDQSSAQQAATVLGVVLGAFTEGWTGGKVRNAALGIVQKSIDRNIAAQVRNLQSERADLASQRGIVSYLYGKLGDIDRSQQMARVMMNDWVDTSLRKAEQQYAGDIRANRAAMLREQNQANSNMNLMKLTAKTVTGGGTRTPTSPFAAEMMKLKLETARAKLRATAGGHKLPPKQAIDLGAAKTSLGLATKARDAAKGLKIWVGSKYLPNTEAAQLRDVYITPLVVSMRKAVETGIMTDKDFARYQRMLDGKFTTQNELVDRLDIIRSHMGTATLGNIEALARGGYNVSKFARPDFVKPLVEAAAGKK
jgi:hypothetical protein